MSPTQEVHPPAVAQRAPAPPRPRVLVVDDEVELRETMELMLHRQYEVRTARDGAEAQAMLGTEPFDLVVADERMPRMRGTDLFVWLRTHQPDVGRVLLTAFADVEAMLRAINEGQVERFLVKPCDPVMLRMAIAETLEQRRLTMENRRLVEDLRQRNHELETTRERLLQTEKLALAGKLAAGIAHDIRNYLTALMGAAELSSLGGTSDLTSPLFEEGVQGIQDLASELMCLAQGRVPHYHVRVADLGELVAQFVSELRRSTIDQRFRLVAEVQRPVTCALAPRRFRRVLWNLVQNASEATPEGGEIRVSCHVDRGQAFLEVRDTGRGIPSEQLERVFEAFFTTRPTGTGLGLEVCRMIVRAHGGTIECKSEIGVGTAFQIRLPLAATSMEPSVA